MTYRTHVVPARRRPRRSLLERLGLRATRPEPLTPDELMRSYVGPKPLDARQRRYLNIHIHNATASKSSLK